MEQKWTMSKEGMRDLRKWLRVRGGTTGDIGDTVQITVVEKPDPKCKFCGVGEVHGNGLCRFCYKYLPSPVAHNCVEGNYSREHWIKMFRDTARRFHDKGPWE